MNKTAELVLSFARFEEKYPKASLEDFARHFLAASRPAKPVSPGMPGHSTMAKLIGRIMRLNIFYANAALKSIGIGGLDEYTYLLTVDTLKEPMKTEVINQNFHELSSGLLISSRLIKIGFVLEKPDTRDKRSKRISLTKKGKAKLATATVVLGRVSALFFDSLGDDDIKLCVSMLSPIEEEFTARWPHDKGKSISEIASTPDPSSTRSKK